MKYENTEIVTVPVLVCKSDIEVPVNYPLHGLDESQLVKLCQLRDLSKNYLSTDNVEKRREEAWCSDACLLRYLRANKFVLADAYHKLQATLIWRRDFKPYYMTSEDITAELSLGKIYLNGFDKQGHPQLHMILRKDNTGDWERSLRYSIYMMEKAFMLLPEGVEKLCILVDFKDMRSGQPMSDTKRWVEILSSHYPERLGHSMLINTSWLMTALLKVLYAFLDPVTKAKLHIIDLKAKREPDGEIADTDIRYFIEESELDASLGGSKNFEFEIETYLKHFLAAPCPNSIQ